MRDRREALKLLAGGTAAAIGTSIITTSTAFADQGTVGCLPTNWPTSLAGALRLVADIQTGFVRATLITNSSSISGSSIDRIGCAGGGTPELQVRWSVGPPVSTGGPVVLIEPGLTNATTEWHTMTAANVVRVVDATNNQRLGTAGTYTLQLQFRAACRQPRLCWRCITVTATFGWNGLRTITGTPTFTSVNDSTNCNNPAPSPNP